MNMKGAFLRCLDNVNDKDNIWDGELSKACDCLPKIQMLHLVLCITMWVLVSCSGIGCVGYWEVVAMGLVFNGTHNCAHHDAVHLAFARCDGNALIFTCCMQTFLSMQNFVLLQNFLS
jgi:hypothetical protein